MSWDLSSVSEHGNTDNSQPSTEPLDPLDSTKPEDSDIKPNKDMLSTELRLEEVVEKDQFLKVSFTENHQVKVFQNLNSKDL